MNNILTVAEQWQYLRQKNKKKYDTEKRQWNLLVRKGITRIENAIHSIKLQWQNSWTTGAPGKSKFECLLQWKIQNFPTTKEQNEVLHRQMWNARLKFIKDYEIETVHFFLISDEKLRYLFSSAALKLNSNESKLIWKLRKSIKIHLSFVKRKRITGMWSIVLWKSIESVAQRTHSHALNWISCSFEPKWNASEWSRTCDAAA